MSAEPADRVEAAWDSGLQTAFAPPTTAAPSVLMQSLHLRAGRNVRVALRSLGGEAEPLRVSAHAVDWQGGGTGRYRVQGELARGGVGVVLLAHDTDLGRDVAVKVLHEHHADDLALLQRFVEEAQIGGQLQHPGIVPVYELGLDLRDRPYFTMKLVQGQTLAALLRLRADPHVEQPRWLGVLARVCETMAYAHARGVVHRDLKPGNVMVGEFGEVLVMDWGFAKVLGAREGSTAISPPVATQRSEPLSVAGNVLGTPAYMPPEQAAGEPDRLDARADVFALGAILCEILTGRPPYTGDDLLRQAKDADLAAAQDALATCDADAGMVALCRACLAADAAARPASAAAVSATLAEHFASAEARAQEARIEAAAALARAGEERKRRRLAGALAAMVMVLLGVGGFLYFQHRERVAFTAREAHAALNRAWQHVAADDLAAATDAVEQAQTVVRAGTPDDTTTAAVADAAARVARLRRDDEIRRRILEVRLRFPPEAGPDGQALLALLRDLRLDVAVPDAAVVADLGELAPLLGQALAAVAFGRPAGGPRGPNPPRPERRVEPAPLLALADVVDPDPVRGEIRAAGNTRDAAALRDLATRLEQAQAPPESSELLALAMLASGARDDALAALEAGVQRHPEDFWLNHLLALLYRDAGPTHYDAWHRHRTLAEALNPMRRYRVEPAGRVPPPPGPGGPRGGPGRRRGR